MMTITKEHIAALCIVGAIVVASTGNDGWGWLIFLAALCL